MAKQIRTYLQRLSPRFLLITIVTITFGAVAYALIAATSAAPYATGQEAEKGTVIGNAQLISTTSASQTSAIRFSSSSGGVGCTSPSDRRLLDQMNASDIKKPWRKTTPELTLYFDVKALPAEYTDYARLGAENRSKSECIEARITSACPSGSICVPMTTSKQDKDNVVGTTFTGTNTNYTVNARIEFYPILNTTPANKRRMTVIHEMGHAFRLGHRACSTAILYTPSRGDNSTMPDATDMHNLRVLYGPTASGAQLEDSGPIVETAEEFR